jgi:hypothetical protein
LAGVANSLAVTGALCGGRTYTGLSLAVANVQTTVLASQCNPNGHNNIHSYIEFTASASGVHYIKVIPVNAGSSDVGSYSLRILPKHDQPGADWNAIDFEPNDVESLAYAMDIGLNNAITSNIEARSSQFSTVQADVDWFRFEAVAGETYVVELFDVANSLAVTGNLCGGRTYAGLSLAVANAQKIVFASQCNPNGHNNVHSYVEFTASASGVHYIKVIPINAGSSDVGSYNLRILPKHDQVGAEWDPASYESNNVASLSYPMQLSTVDTDNSLVTAIEALSSQYSTVYPDQDWFGFEAVSGVTYTVEIFDVAPSLLVTGALCGGRTYVGLSLSVSNPQQVQFVNQCNPVTVGNVHTSVSFTADTTGVYYINVRTINTGSTDSGAFSIRVR